MLPMFKVTDVQGSLPTPDEIHKITNSERKRKKKKVRKLKVANAIKLEKQDNNIVTVWFRVRWLPDLPWLNNYGAHLKQM